MGPMSTSEHRPSAVTHACLLAGTGALLTLFTIFGMLSDWGSLEVREQVEAALESSPIRSVAVEDLLEAARIVLMVVAAGAVAGLVLAVFTARRDRAARIGLTVLAAAWLPVALIFGALGILLSAMGAATLALLWRPESRQWFADPSSAAGVPKPDPMTEEPAAMTSPPPGQQGPPDPARGHGGYPVFGGPGPGGQPPQPSAGQPPPGPTYGPAHGHPPQGPAYGQPPYGAPYGAPYGQGYGQPPRPGIPDRRPGGVTAAAVITLVGASLALVGGLIVSLFFLLARDSFEDGVGDGLDASGSELSFVTSFLGWFFVAATVLAAVAIVLAIQLLRDRQRVRVPLVVLSAVTTLMGILTFPLGLLWSAAAITVIILLFAGSAGAWFDLKNHRADQQRASY
jgi:hypothetical protein